MAKQTWTVHLEDGAHTVELEHGYWSGRRIIHVDGKLVSDTKKLMDTGSNIPIQVGGHDAIVRITTNGITFKYDLTVDGRSVTTGEQIAADAPTSRFEEISPPGSSVAFTREKMERDIRNSGYILVVVGLPHLLVPEPLFRALGAAMIAVGLGAIRFRKRWMMILLGLILVAVGATNISTSGPDRIWFYIGCAQIGLGTGQVLSYRRFPKD